MDLRTYIETDPDNLGFAPLIVAGNDGGIADLINVKGKTKAGIIDTAILAAWAAKTGMRAVIEDESVDKTSPLRSSALAMLDLLRGNIPTGFNTAYPDNLAMLAAWVQIGKMSAQVKDSLILLGNSPCSYGEAAGFSPNIHNLDIARAFGRNGFGG